MSNYLTTDRLKKISLLPEAPLGPEASGICHICHMVNLALHHPTLYVIFNSSCLISVILVQLLPSKYAIKRWHSYPPRLLSVRTLRRETLIH